MLSQLKKGEKVDLEFEDSKRKIYLSDVKDFLFQGKTLLILSGVKRVQIKIEDDFTLKMARVNSEKRKEV